jgi:hypothetical protein
MGTHESSIGPKLIEAGDELKATPGTNAVFVLGCSDTLVTVTRVQLDDSELEESEATRISYDILGPRVMSRPT